MNSAFQLKITIDDIKPSIWRRVVVPYTLSFYHLHHILQIAFDWENYHLFQFKIGKTIIGIPDTEMESYGKIHDAREIFLKDFLSKEKGNFEYEYDFGDSWVHKIIIEKILPSENLPPNPYCIDGEKKSPPEDCGGTHGYQNMLEILNDKSNPEREEYLQWLGVKKYDPNAFDLQKINAQLVKTNSYIKKFEKEGGFD